MANSKRQCACGCKQRERRESMLITPNGAAFINAGHAASYGKERAARLRKKSEPKRLPTKLEYRRNDYAHQFDLTKKVAQRLANLLDSERTCISCDCPRNVQFCGGHFRTVGAHREMALDIRNIHGQCNRNCNMGLSGNIGGTKKTLGFRAGLMERYGAEYVGFLESYQSHERKTAAELIAMRAEFNAEIRRLEKGLPPSRDWRALPKQEARAA